MDNDQSLRDCYDCYSNLRFTLTLWFSLWFLDAPLKY